MIVQLAIPWRSSAPVCALYVDERGPYPSLLGAEKCWDSERDAREYEGPNPVIAHPPCGPYSRLKAFCSKQDRTLAPIAVEQVRAFGGVLEHPAHSELWPAMRLPKPGWFTDRFGGWTLELDQVDYGHRAKKATWLYIVGVDRSIVLPKMNALEPTAVVDSCVPSDERDLPAMSSRSRHLTPPDFARFLVWLASSVRFG
jgi:hypothetical protein